MYDVLVLPVWAKPVPPTQETSYRVIAEPPSSAGAVQSSFTAWWPSVTVRPVGAPGTLAGVAVASLESAALPTLFTARTWKVYSVPFVRPVTVWLAVVAPLPEMSSQLP